jgi:hypothetical protein
MTLAGCMDRKGHAFGSLLAILTIACSSTAICAQVRSFSELTGGTHRVASVVGTCESIRGAMASYAADSVGNLFPLYINDWPTLVRILNQHGASLKPTAYEQGMSQRFIYKTLDIDGDGRKGDDYCFIFQTAGVPDTLTGALVEARSSGIMRWSGSM